MRESRSKPTSANGASSSQAESSSDTPHRLSGGSSSSSDSQQSAGPSSSPSGHKQSNSSQGERSSGGRADEKERSLAHNVQSTASQLICNPLRNMVSQNRRRFQQDGFDLDLTYITDRIIAMGYPADTKEALYRNSMGHTVKFLESRHSGHYMVFNLRGQYVYDTAKFHHRVLSFEMTDHHPPRLELMAPFCREVDEYLHADKHNIVAVHCKAGKGRTGVMICAYLVYINFYRSPRQNMDYYSVVRTMNNKGVTIPSQRRYVYYFHHLRQNHLNYMPLRVELVGIYIEFPPKNSFMHGPLSLRVANGEVDVYLGEDMCISKDTWASEALEWAGGASPTGEDSHDPSNPKPHDIISRRAYGWTVPSDRRVFLEGDVRVDVKHKAKMFKLANDGKKIGHVWFNTMFACPGYCGGMYRHGDEAHPYPPGETTIAHRKTHHRPKSGSSSVPNSPPQTPKTNRSFGGSGRPAARTPSFDSRKTGRTSSKINKAVKKIADAAANARNSEPNIERDGEEKEKTSDKKRTATNNSARDRSGDDFELLLPPGLDAHCSQECMELIYGKELAPRFGIEEMLRDAHLNGLMKDSYNERRLSLPQNGRTVNKAPVGRPKASGPFCVVRNPEEHVQYYPLWEVDRAVKNNDLGQQFRLIVVTRCVPAENEQINKVADFFMNLTHEKQDVKDRVKAEKIEQRQRKIQSASGFPGEGSYEQLTTESCRDEEQWKEDPRTTDPYLRRFFYRQRSSSLSVYPEYQYRCTLLDPTTPVTDRPPLTPGTPLGVPDWTLGDVREESDLEMDVRSYHPHDSNWVHSNSSASSSSSEQDAGCLGPCSSSAGLGSRSSGCADDPTTPVPSASMPASASPRLPATPSPIPPASPHGAGDDRSIGPSG